MEGASEYRPISISNDSGETMSDKIHHKGEKKKTMDRAGHQRSGQCRVQHLADFDLDTFYGNELTMTEAQVHHLQHLLHPGNLNISYYVCSVNKTFTSSKAKMYLSVHFTKEFLMPFLDMPIEKLRLKLEVPP